MEGFEIWDVILRGCGQLRISPAGRVVGFDLPALLTICTALGYDAQALMLLFHFAESGLKQAVRNHGDSSNEECVDPPDGDRRW